MSEAVPSSSCVLPDNFTETDVAAQPGDIMLVNSPPDDAKEISNHLTSSLERHSGQDTNSDSGDSLFITQKCAPQRRRRSNRRSNFRAHRDSPEDEYDASTSEEEHPEDGEQQQKKKSCTTPKFTFHFLKERRMTRLPSYQNRKLHYYAMGGYFRYTEQLWDSYQTGEDLLLSLPTVDQDGEAISPLSEEEDETTENEDIRVVEKKLFVVSKTKNSQPWCNPRKRSSEETQHNEEQDNAAGEPQGGVGMITRRRSMRISLLRGLSSSKTKESDEIPEETKSVDERVSTSGNLPAETEMGRKSRSRGKESRPSGLIPEENEQMLGNESDATCRGLSAEQSDREAMDPHTGADEQTGVRDDDIECRTIKVKNRKKEKKDREDDKCVEEGKDQSLEGVGGHQTAPSANLIITETVEAPCMEKKKKKKKKLENQYLRQEADEKSDQQKEEDFVVVCETENVDIDSLKTNKAAETVTNDVHVPKKRKKKKKYSSDPNQTTTEQPQATDHSSNGEVFQEMLESNGFKRKKHKKKKSQSPDDNQTDVDLSNDVPTVPENTDFIYKRKKKKKYSSDLNQTGTEQPQAIDHSTNGEVLQEMLESNGFKRKKHKKKKNQSPDDNQTDVDLSNDASTVPENTDFVYKKKKKKHVSDQVGLAEEDESVEKTPKDRQDIEPKTKKKKKKKGDISESNSEDMLASGDYSELVRKKKKKKKRTSSVLSADDEEQSPSAHEGCPERPEVSAGELAVESANVSEHLQESKDGKKKKKRSATVSESEERELEETSEALVKNKEKHKKTERLTKCLESVEQSQTEEAVVVKKKKKKSRQEDPDEEDRTNPGAGCKFNATSSKTFPAELETSSSRCVERKRKRNAKRRLHNPDKDFLSDLNS